MLYRVVAFICLLFTASIHAAEPLWGPVSGGLSIGISLEGPASSRLLRVTFRNQGTTPLAFVIGGKTGIGSIHSLDSVSISPEGQSCSLMDATVGGVAGFVEPIVVRLAPGETQSATIATQKMFCIVGRQTIPLDERLRSGYQLRTAFTGKADANAWGQVKPGWMGTVVSGTFRVE